MTPLAIVVGLALLFFGRQLFWLFVGGAGFVAGMSLATQLIQGQPDWVVLLIAVAAGVLGAILSIFLQRLAIGIAGFVTGGYALWDLAARNGREELAWVAFAIGGIIGAVLVLVLFDWALIFLSALTGALLIVDNLHLEQSTGLVVLVGLFFIGVISQSLHLRRQAPKAVEPPPPPQS
jgi:hypothetical protein